MEIDFLLERKKLSRKRVIAGAAYLDENFPGWERKVNVSILNIADAQVCICGQAVAKGWCWVDTQLNNKGLNSTDYGFVDGADGDAWVELLKERFDSGILSDTFQEVK